jgi:hypothetical protein
MSCSAEMQLLPSLLMEFLRHNYSMVHIPWGIAHNSYAMKVRATRNKRLHVCARTGV